MAEIIKANGTIIEDVRPAKGTRFKLEQMQAIVGGYIEYVQCKDGKHVLVINEEGKIEGLPYNEKATELAELMVGDYIVGDALYCLAKEAR